jgi:hypothetical protein
MHKHGERMPKSHIINGFEYYPEDMDCDMCQYWRGKKGCSRAVCRCEAEYVGAHRQGRRKQSRDKRSRKR